MAILGADFQNYSDSDESKEDHLPLPNLASMPYDTQFEIATYLPLSDLFSLRGTCQGFREIGVKENLEEDLVELTLSKANGGNLATWSRANLSVAKRVLSHEPYLNKLAFNDVLRIWAAHPEIFQTILSDTRVFHHIDSATLMRMSLVSEEVAITLLSEPYLKQQLSLLEYLNLALRYKSVATLLASDRDAMREINEYYIISPIEKKSLNFDDLRYLLKENPSLELPDVDLQKLQAYFSGNQLFEGISASHLMGEYRRIKFAQKHPSCPPYFHASYVRSACVQPENFYSMEIGEIKARRICGDESVYMGREDNVQHPSRCQYEEAIHILYYVSRGSQLLLSCDAQDEQTPSARP